MGIKRGKILKKFLAVSLAVIALASLSFINKPVGVEAATITLVPGNPTCTDLGFPLGFKPTESYANGTFTFPDGHNTVTVTSSDNIFVNWSATLVIDAVIVKGGNAANLYDYRPGGSTSDVGLHAPINASGGFAGLSHVEFCYHYSLSVVKTATTSLKRTYSWEIAKNVSPASHSLLAGETDSSDYTVDLTKHTVDSNWAVAGTVTVTNPDPVHSAQITSVIDTLDGFGALTLVCPVSFPTTLAASASFVCAYQQALDSPLNTENHVTATATGSVGSGSGSAAVDFANAVVSEVGPATITVSDDQQTPQLIGSFSDSDQANYSANFACSTDNSLYENGHYRFTVVNTATINETGQSDSATVTVDCFAPTVTKTAATSFARTWNWTIAKTSSVSQLNLDLGATTTVPYQVTAQTTGSVDSGWAATGTVTVTNPSPDEAMTVGLTDNLTGDITPTFSDCTFPLTVAADSNTVCHYSASLPDGSDRVNTATVTLAGLTTSATANAAFTGTSPATLVDDCVTVTDTNVSGPLGTLCQGDSPHTYNYTIAVGPFQVCGDFKISNVATATTNTTSTLKTASLNIGVTVPCLSATRTLGFWQTHTSFTSSVFAAAPISGNLTVGTGTHVVTITNILSPNGSSRLYGAYYAGIAKDSLGKKRSSLDQARMQLLQQLVTAKLNCAAFTCSSATQAKIVVADAAYAGTNTANILSSASQLDAYNNSGDSIAIPALLGASGSATPGTSQALANIAFWNAP